MWEFERPLFLLLIPLAVFSWWRIWGRGRGTFFFPLASVLSIPHRNYFQRWLLPGTLLLSLLFTTIAIAGPYRGRTVVADVRISRYFLLVNDVSGSVVQLISKIFLTARALALKYPEDVFDLTLFSSYAVTLAGVTPDVIDLYIDPNGDLYPETKELTRILGGGTQIDWGLLNAFEIAMVRMEFLDDDKITEFRRALQKKEPSGVDPGDILGERRFDGGIMIIVSDFNMYETDYDIEILLSLMKDMGIRLFMIDVASNEISNEIGKTVLSFADKTWAIRNLSNDPGSQFAVIFEEIDKIAPQPWLKEERRAHATRVPHSIVLGLGCFVFSLFFAMSRRFSILPI